MPERRHGRYAVLALLVLTLCALAAAAAVFASAHASLGADSEALARVSLPLGGGQIHSVSVTAGPHSASVPVNVRDGRIWPVGLLPVHETVNVDVVVRRPGWIAWLAGHSQHLHLTLLTPAAHLASEYVTLRPGQPLQLHFTGPVATVSYGSGRRLTRQVLPVPQSLVTVPHDGLAGTIDVSATPRTWETGSARTVSWFPAGAAASAVASPAPGTRITPLTPITLSFSRPVSQVLGAGRPPVSPASAGTWRTLSSHAIEFVPSGYGYGIGARVAIGLPGRVMVLGAHGSAGPPVWTVPAGSTLRLQQLLAELGYLPLRFDATAPPPATPGGQEQAAITPPAGSFAWRWSDTPDQLRSEWSPGADGVMTRGAVMAFENDHGLTTDGSPGPQVWHALISAALTGQRSSFGYTYVSVDKGSQHLSLWHDGRTVLTTAVNTGVAQAPTASGTFPVYEHLRVTTMSGTNVDGSHYNDPGIQFVSYFNGGDALHAFTRAQYGFPQSLGCVEMALGPAGQVWPLTPIGTLVHVA